MTRKHGSKHDEQSSGFVTMVASVLGQILLTHLPINRLSASTAGGAEQLDLASNCLLMPD
ncbi:hypothetical protein SVXHx_5100 (plasmid) [Haloferax volcanii]|nr:hypothetical protein SVXHx_5100 [Haloferax lucentense]